MVLECDESKEDRYTMCTVLYGISSSATVYVTTKTRLMPAWAVNDSTARMFRKKDILVWSVYSSFFSLVLIVWSLLHWDSWFSPWKEKCVGRKGGVTTSLVIELVQYTGCNRRNGPNFGRVFLMLNYTDITQNTSVQSWTVSEIMASEVSNFDSCYTLTDYQIHIETGRNMWFL